MASFEEDIFNAIKADWSADSLKWGSSGEGTPKVRAVERWGTDASPPPPSVEVRVTAQRVPTCTGTVRWSGVAELTLRFLPGTQLPSENYDGLRDAIVSRIVSRLDDFDLSGVAGASHTLGRAQLIGTPQTAGSTTTIRLAIDGEGA